MAHEPTPSLEFPEHHLSGMDLVGAVALPSPFPASAKIYVVRYPCPGGGKDDEVRPRLFVKIVETINSNHVITRVVSPEYIRGVKWLPGAGNASTATAAVESGDRLRAEITEIKWDKAVKDPRTSYEVPLHPTETGIVYVAESAPVLLRHEQTVPASVSVAASPAMLAAACPHR